MNTQKGFAHAVLLIGLLIALIGALGFIFWQNFIHKEPEESQTSVVGKNHPESKVENNTPVVSNNVFDSDQLSFDYPNEWQEKKDQYSESVARIESNDFERSVGMGLESGSDLVIEETTQKNPPQGAGINNIEEIHVDGKKAYRYEIEYEGYRLQAIVPSSEVNYLVTMETSAKPSADQRATFELVLQTLDIK